ncbi:hypothetical protein GCM10010840_32510 [Deinococcus aerolatus]|uniref:Uncharacterized protein n=1 Tax=Deinococcus aerolatus TaxID=522487 RepID=A0ABQ2GF56_9DEIO|nr:hypothetical protein GCM10010840_32510 [Deinococcus aerolatus]
MHVLGHVHVSRGPQSLPLSSKAAALLTYLALEGRPHHREHLAGLLWDTSDALRNLRVELARLKGRGIDPFPARQPMLSLGCATDLDSWLAIPQPTQERDLLGWLAPLRGPALSGLEDLGSSAFRGWVDQQRQAIHDRVEERLQLTYSRLEEQGLSASAELVRARADLMGLALSARPASAPPAALTFRWPAQEEQLRQVLARAGRSPQLVLLQGHSETRRALLERMVQNTSWSAVQLRASTRQPLLLAALAQHLWQFVPVDQRAQTHLPHGQNPETDLIELGQVMVALGRPLMIALHDVAYPGQWPDWLEPMLSFLLDLPLPLVLVLSTTWPALASGLRPALSQLVGPRLHTVTLPPLSVHDLMRSLEAQGSAGLAGTQRARATRVVQCSEGLPVYVRALLGEKDTPLQHDARVPRQVSDWLLADLAGVSILERERLARLAQVYGRFDVVLASTLLGECAPATLGVGLQAGLLAPAGTAEDLTLPHLDYRSSDAENHLIFASDVVRSALAATLPATERHALRATLAAVLVSSQPALGLVYATRAALPELVQTARRALPPRSAACDRRASAAPATPAEEPPGRAHPRHEVRTPNGYRVGLDSCFLEVMRRGPPGSPPLLTLRLPGHGTGRWTLTARVDVADSAPQHAAFPVPFVLGVRAGTGPRVIYTVGPVLDQPADSDHQHFGGVVPLGQWFSLSGQGGSGPLELSVRAGDIALTVGALRWGEHSLHDLCLNTFLGTPVHGSGD